jgi:hypothetical protein
MLRNWRGGSHFVVLALTACSSEKATGPSAPSDPEIIVSAPIPRASLPGGAGRSGSVVFVSAMPQAVSGTAHASVSGEDGLPQTTSVRDGGFDPVAVAAVSGDVVSLSLTDSGGATKAEDLTVRSGRPPRVVRTSPAPHRTDVPLNVVIRVVFSSPVALESARSAIRLTTGAGVAVPGTVEAVGTNVVAVDYVITAGSLAPETDYRLDVTAGVRDVLGQALAEPVSVEFRTGSSADEAVARLEVYGSWRYHGAFGVNVEQRLGEPAEDVGALALSADGYQLDVPISWQSEDPAVVRISQDAPDVSAGRGRVTVVGKGRTRVVARVGGFTEAIRILVWDEVTPATFAGYRLVIADGHELVALNGDGSNRTTLTSVPRAYSPSAGPDGRLVFSSGRVPSGFDFMSASGAPLNFVATGTLSIRSADGTVSAFAAGDGAAICPAWSPDGARIAFTRLLPGSGLELTVRSADGSAERVLFSSPGIGGLSSISGNQWICPQWSPDGERIAYFVGGLAFSIRPDGTDSRPLFQVLAEDPEGFGGSSAAALAGPWSRDGRTMLTTDYTVFGLRDLVTGIAWVGGEYFIGAAAWSPDGAVFALGTRWGSTAGTGWEDGLWLISADGAQRARVPGAAAFYGVTFVR